MNLKIAFDRVAENDWNLIVTSNGELPYFLPNLVLEMNVKNWIKVSRFSVIDILHGKEGNELLELHVPSRILHLYMDISAL